jgi:hypothetical protein
MLVRLAAEAALVYNVQPTGHLITNKHRHTHAGTILRLAGFVQRAAMFHHVQETKALATP